MWVYRGGEEPVEILKQFKREKCCTWNYFHPKYMEHRSFFDSVPEKPGDRRGIHGKDQHDVATDIGTGVDGYPVCSGCSSPVLTMSIRIYRTEQRQ